MADTEVKASLSLGANEPPSPSPSTAPIGPLPDAPIRATRTQANHLQPLPTNSNAYRAIANLNRGFEHDRRNLAELQEFNFFPGEELIAWGNILGRLQAEVSLRLLDALRDRLVNNVLYYDRLCLQRAPEDVLIAADEQKRELAADQQPSERQPDEGS
jgi:hypothetical protein